jgi:hypothetical protein
MNLKFTWNSVEKVQELKDLGKAKTSSLSAVCRLGQLATILMGFLSQ